MNTTRGFTLIELLIVLAIGGIIVSVVVPHFFSKSTNYDAPPARSQSVDNVSCQGGFVVKNGDLVVKDGQVVKC